MKMDWNHMKKRRWQLSIKLLTHSNYEDGLKRYSNTLELYLHIVFWRIPIMKMDWNWNRLWLNTSRHGLLTHSNYEDGLKHFCFSVFSPLLITFDAFQLWRWIETLFQDKQLKCLCDFWRIPIMKMDWNWAFQFSGFDRMYTFDAFQLWRWIETCSQYSPSSTNQCFFWRIPIMKMDWNIVLLNFRGKPYRAFDAFQLWRWIETFILDYH